jgi:hypothetical protein
MKLVKLASIVLVLAAIALPVVRTLDSQLPPPGISVSRTLDSQLPPPGITASQGI